MAPDPVQRSIAVPPGARQSTARHAKGSLCRARDVDAGRDVDVHVAEPDDTSDPRQGFAGKAALDEGSQARPIAVRHRDEFTGLVLCRHAARGRQLGGDGLDVTLRAHFRRLAHEV